ncbi:DUF6441 family protein [Alkalilacustris brevis]|uniref:DUF6441 family protein n=1 Tax=Alkalilacustris brevis TaxID=2026338 RepID=UPI0012D366DF|nr:DUF6441 family protein [Alkalilacustris brevis]
MIRMEVAGNLAAMMAVEIKAGERAVSKAVTESGTDLKTAWRAQITSAGLGQRLARTIRSALFPKGKPSLSAAALVWSKASVIVSAHVLTQNLYLATGARRPNFAAGPEMISLIKATSAELVAKEYWLPART